MKLSAILAISLCFFGAQSQASVVGLDGTSLTTQVQFQPTEIAERRAISFSATATVGSSVEFQNLADLEIASNTFGLFVVPVLVDAGNDFIELRYEPAGSGGFASGFFNGYLFQFDGGVPVAFQNAFIDTNVTNVSVTDEDLSFVGNQLFLDVASRSYNSSSVIRIAAEVAPVPLPATLPLLFAGIAAVFAVSRRRCLTANG